LATRTRKAPAVRKDANKRRKTHRDVGAIVLFLAGVVVGGGLLLADRGVVGQAAADLFRLLFGVGAWLVPPALWMLACAVAFGREIRLPSFTGGLVLMVLCVLGFAARRDVFGSWFDPETLMTGGGYVGAGLRAALHFAIGAAAPVAIGAIGVLGLVTATSFPLFSLVERGAIGLYTRLSTVVRRKRAANGLRPAPNGTRSVAARLRPNSETTVEPTETALVEMPASRERPKPTIAEPPKPPRTPPANLEGEKREGYVLPPLSLLHDAPPADKAGISEVGKKIEVLETTLEEFGIEADVVEVAQGPTVTRYEIRLGPGIKVQKIVSLADNLAMSLAAIGLRVEAPIPGKSAIGVEVPNDNPGSVSLKEVLARKEVMGHPARLLIALGKDVSGEARYADLAKMPHILIGGATNAGKSVALASFIATLLMRNTPKDVRLVLIDPKRVELSLFDGIPHLMCGVVKEVKKTASVFKALLNEMDRRYDVLSSKGVRNIDGYNQKVSYNERLPYIVVVVDELADLMMQQGAEIEHCICRLAQLARATGIHLVLATQRPSVDVITGTIKANISSRIAFAVSSAIDSRTILDGTGAERLIGRGDMLYLPIDASKPMRIQGCFISEADISAIVDHWKQQEEPSYLLTPVETEGTSSNGVDENGDDDPLYMEAVRLVVSAGQASTSMLQRKFKIGYQRAARLVDMMEQRGVVGPMDGPRPREILISRSEWAELYGEQL
jgi:S-DNA-T family DNA segregation ATPase FtsK/SpoIIIE